jgi:hypothetical protein
MSSSTSLHGFHPRPSAEPSGSSYKQPFGARLVFHCPVHSFDGVLDLHDGLAVQLFGDRPLKIIDEPATSGDQFVPQRGQLLDLGHEHLLWHLRGTLAVILCPHAGSRNRVPVDTSFPCMKWSIESADVVLGDIDAGTIIHRAAMRPMNSSSAGHGMFRFVVVPARFSGSVATLREAIQSRPACAHSYPYWNNGRIAVARKSNASRFG